MSKHLARVSGAGGGPSLLFSAAVRLAALLLLTACDVPGDPRDGTADTAAQLDAGMVLDLSIAFHDPGALWSRGTFHFEIEETRPEGEDRKTEVWLDNPRRLFRLKTVRDGRVLEMTVEGDEVTATYDGEPTWSNEEAETLGLTPAAILLRRDYYLYLWGLPMKLRDPGTVLDPVARRTRWQGEEALELRVTYDPEVGSDRWFFFVDPTTYALLGYRFEHTGERQGEGEYILLDGLVETGGLRLPRSRAWYRSGSDEYLGTDRLVEPAGDDGAVDPD